MEHVYASPKTCIIVAKKKSYSYMNAEKKVTKYIFNEKKK